MIKFKNTGLRREWSKIGAAFAASIICLTLVAICFPSSA